MRFEAGRWVEDDGTPVDPETMLTASQGPGPAGALDETPSTGGDKTVDKRKTTKSTKDPRKNRARQ